MTATRSGPGPALLSARRRISVLIPAYNHAAYVGEAIESVLAQDWPDIELRLLDDGSTDDTLAQAERAVAGQSRVRCIVESQANAGVSTTLNRLMARADGDLLAILNSDDRFAPGRLTRIAGASCPGRPFFGFSRVSFIHSDASADRDEFEGWYEEAMGKAASLPTAGFALLLANLSISSSNFVFSRDLAEKTEGFDPALPLTQDWDFALRCVRFAEPVFVPAALLDYRVHPSNSWRRHQATRVEQSAAVLHRYFFERRPPENAMAPAAAAWPRFLPMFLAIARPLFTGDSLGSVLAGLGLAPAPPGRPSAESPHGEVERAAIARLVHAAQTAAPHGYDPLTPHRTAEHWSAVRARLGR